MGGPSLKDRAHRERKRVHGPKGSRLGQRRPTFRLPGPHWQNSLGSHITHTDNRRGAETKNGPCIKAPDAVRSTNARWAAGRTGLFQGQPRDERPLVTQCGWNVQAASARWKGRPGRARMACVSRRRQNKRSTTAPAEPQRLRRVGMKPLGRETGTGAGVPREGD